jgi:hypothetical protein
VGLTAVTRDEILAFRRRTNALEERLPYGPDSLRRAAWCGVQDSMPRAALLSIHARVSGTPPDVLDDPTLAQIWGPRFSAFVVAREDVPIFTLSRMPDDAKGRERAERTADLLEKHLKGERRGYGIAGHALDVNPNSLRYGTVTGRILMRWEGARQPIVWTVPPPSITPDEARLELGRRYLHVYGPSTPAAFAKWAGITARAANAAFHALSGEVTAVTTPIGDGWLLTSDEPLLGPPTGEANGARFLPSGDAYWLRHGPERALLVPDESRQPELWTPRVWPGALLVRGEIVGIWQRADERVSIKPWHKMNGSDRQLVEVEAMSMPLPGLKRPISVTWEA